MPEEVLDWTLDEAPQPPGEAGEPIPPEAPRPRRPSPRRLLGLSLLSAALLLVALAGAYAYQRVGWERLRAQVEREVRYEDEHALRGDVAVVRAVQAQADPAWVERRVTEAALGLPATLPAAHLRPTGDPPHVTAFAQESPDVFVATVERTYLDSAGGTFAFALEQRYRNTGPGLWERLPPLWGDRRDLPTLWVGQRVFARLPPADRNVIEPLLAQADEYLVQACAAWACPDNLRTDVRFTDRPDILPQPMAPAWQAQHGFGRYPAALDVVYQWIHADWANWPRLPSPRLSGRPVDAPAREALVRGLVLQTLVSWAGQLSGPSRGGDNYAAALIARAEVRLGLASPLTYTPTSERYRTPEGLWSAAEVETVEAETRLANELAALDFLDLALDGQPPAADGVLLRSLGSRGGLHDWLRDVLGARSHERSQAWVTRTTRAILAGEAGQWPDLEGLAYACQGQVWQWRDGEPALVSDQAETWVQLPASAIAPGGRYLAYILAGNKLWVADTQTRQSQQVDWGRWISWLGWAADGQAIYFRNPNHATLPQTGFELMRAAPHGAGEPERVLADLVVPIEAPLIAGSQAVVGLWDLSAGPVLAPGTAAWAIVPVLEPGRGLRRFDSPILVAPDGGMAALWGRAQNLGEVALESLVTGERRRLVGAAELGFEPEAPILVQPLAWSPDSEWLAVMAAGLPQMTPSFYTWLALFAVRADGSEVRRYAAIVEDKYGAAAAFSADSRFLELSTAGPDVIAPNYWIVDLAPGAIRVADTLSGSTAWAPSGHWLASASPQGVRVRSAESGDSVWLTPDGCGTVAWPPLTERP